MNMQGESSVKVAIVGTGLIGPRHARSVRASKSAELLCLIDPRPDAEAVAKEFNVPLFCSIEDMLSEGIRPEAAIVCTPNDTHVAIGLQLLDADIHVLVEKPVSTELASGQQLVNAARASGKHLLVGHHRRFNPYISATKQALENGTIGRPIAISGIWATCKPDSYFKSPADWRAKANSGGPILINLVHEIDILQFLLGPIVRVHAEQTKTQRGFAVEEGAAILYIFQSGVVGTFILSDATPSAHNFESGTGENPTIPHSGRDFYRIMGTKGTLSVGDMVLEKHSTDVENSWENPLQQTKIPVGSEVPFDEQVTNFLNVIKGTEKARCTGADGLSALKVCAAVSQAMTTGEPVDIDV